MHDWLLLTDSAWVRIDKEGGPAMWAIWAGDVGGLLPRQAAVQQPQNEHFSADATVRVAIPFGVHNALLVLPQRDPEDGPVLALGSPPGQELFLLACSKAAL